MEATLPEILRLDLAELRLPDWHPDPNPTCRVHAFVIAHPDGAILVDSGMGTGNEELDELYQPRRQDLLEALGEHGIRGDDVVAIANTHLHFDHCGGNSRLPGRPIYVREAEYAASKTPYYTLREWVDFEGADLRCIEGEFEIASGVRLLATPGHTPGHQSVLVEAGGRRALICGQAAYSAAEFASSQPNEKEAARGLFAEYRESFAMLHSLGAEQVHFSHDATIWTPGP